MSGALPLGQGTLTRVAARGRQGAVAAHNREAATAGISVLADGGTAFDAIVAMSFVTTVRESAMNGVGGGGVFLGYRADTRDVVEVDFYGRTPRELPTDVFEPYLTTAATDMEFGWPGTRDNVSQRGALSVGVPAHVRGVETVHSRLGSMPWARLLAPAQTLATDGYFPDEEDTYFLVADAATIGRFDEARRLYLPDGLEGLPTRRLRLGALAGTLGRIREAGAAGFYEADVARATVEAVRAGGGFLSLQDLADYRPETGSGLSRSYHGTQVHTSSGLLGGITLLTMLNIAAELGLGSYQHNSVDYLDTIARVMRLAWASRFQLLAREQLRPGDIEAELSPERAAEGAALVRSGEEIWPDPVAGTWREPDSHTTSIAATDAEGNLATITQTLGQCYGSCIAGEGTGALLYDLTYWMDPRPGTISSVGGWRRPPGHATPVVLTKDGAPLASFSAPGGRKIVAAVFQLVLNMVDFGMDVQAAISAPRIHVEGVHPVSPTVAHGRIVVDHRLPTATIAELAGRGYEPTVESTSGVRLPFARPVGVGVDEGAWAGADPHGKSIALAI